MNKLKETAELEQRLKDASTLDLAALLPELARLVEMRRTLAKEHLRTDSSADIYYLSGHEIIECDEAICKLLALEASSSKN